MCACLIAMLRLTGFAVVGQDTGEDSEAVWERAQATDDVAQTEAIGKPRTSSSLYSSARADGVLAHPVAAWPAGEGGSMSLPPQPSGSGLLFLRSVSDPELRCLWVCTTKRYFALLRLRAGTDMRFCTTDGLRHASC